MRSPTRLLAISLLLGLARLAAAACGDHPLDAAEMTAARAAGDLACPCVACGAGGCSSHTTTTTTTLPVSCASAAEDTFDTIQQRIFGYHGCAVSSCHGPLAQGNLDLRDGAAYGSLVGVPAVNPVAARAGKLRVAPGNAAASFLSQKLHGTLATGEGARMPYVGTSL